MDIEELLSTELDSDPFSNSSNVHIDDDNDDDKQTSVKKSIPHLSSDLFATIETYDDTPISISFSSNSSLNSTQSFERQLKLLTVPQDNTHEVDSVRCLRNSIPNGSNNLEDTVSNDFDRNIREEVLKICNLLPTLTYESVYKVLKKNCKAKNRIELSLWDLLPIKRPRVKHLDDLPTQPKRLKHSVLYGTLNSQTACSSNDSTSRETVLQANCANRVLEHSAEDGKVSSTTESGILRPAKLVINDKSSRTEHVMSQSSFILAPPKLTSVGAKLLINKKATKSSAYIEKHENNKFINQKYVPLGKNVFMSTSGKDKCLGQMLHQYMEYLKYMEIIKQQKSIGECKDFDFDERNMTRDRFLRSDCSTNIDTKDTSNNVAKPSTSGVIFSVPERKELYGGTSKQKNRKQKNVTRNKAAVKNIALPFKFLQMHNRLIFMFPQADKNPIRQICKNLSKLEDTSSMERLQTLAEHTLVALIDFAALFFNIRACTASTDTKWTAITDSNISLHQVVPTNTRALRQQSRMNSSSSVTQITSNNTFSFSRPSTSVAFFSAPETSQVIGGARKKQIIEKEGSKSNKDAEKKNITLPLKFEEMYETLVLMFPQLDKDFIRQTCKNVSKVKDVCSLEQLQTLAEHTLQNKEIQSADIDIRSLCQEEEESNQYIYLLGIFPNADPTYLKKVVARTRDNPSEIINFIQSQWENPTYPTKEEKLQKIRITQQQMQYTTKFDVKQFLEMFPDPLTYFTNPNRICKFSSDAVEFLKSHFTHFEESHLKHVYSSSNYNLTLTVQKLENTEPYIKLALNVCSWEKCPPLDISLLQEFAFIIHRKEIVEYLDILKKTEMIKFKELKEKNELLECQCCYDNECMPSNCSTCDDGHIFCNSCILKGTESQLAQGKTCISCFSNCDGEFTVPTLQKILSPIQFSIFIRKKQEAEVMAAKVEGLVSCPFCHFASIPPPGDKVFKCLNPECMKESCRLCKQPNHIPLRCYEEKSDQARLFLEEKMTEALVRKCYECSRPYFKEDGCNKITCSCGAMMCYICDIPIHNYDHFNTGRCPLWSDNHSINNETVRAVAIQTAELIKRKDPNVAVNADDLLKYLPSTSNNAITNRVQKIVTFDK